ncbi:MAG: C45 family autoproteolytic acyltransferase/hydrolase [Anaerolineae bacterium]
MLPVIEVSGAPVERGRQHGRKARDRIAHNLAVYFSRFENEGRVGRSEVLARAAEYWPVVCRQNPDYADELRGLAEGSGNALLDMVALNLRYEILYHQFTANALADAAGGGGSTDAGSAADGCTAFAVAPEASSDGRLLMGQNWDWIPDVQGVVVRRVKSQPRALYFTEAGIVGGKIGLNSARVALAITGLTSTDDDWSRLGKPFHVRCYEVLNSLSLEEAVAAASDGGGSCSAGFLIGQSGAGVVNIEAAPGAACRLAPNGGMLVHTNHFIAPEALGVTEPPNPRRPGSENRLSQMRRILATEGPHSPESLRRGLRDHTGHPDSVCRHFEPDGPDFERYETVASVVMDVGSGVMWITDGPPCESPYIELRLDEA